jgi:protein-L-isoaspartate(D-aspartate) O-methyltransferase
MMNDPFLIARTRMVERLRESNLAGEEILAAMEQLPRQIFLDPALWPRAHGRDVLPIGFEQTMSHPEVVAFMTESLQVRPGLKVLEIGTGSGYQAALLALLGARVWTMERIENLLTRAREGWRELRSLPAIEARVGDGYQGWPTAAPFDRILVTTAPREVPMKLLGQLKDGGVLVLPVEEGGEQRLVRLKLKGKQAWREDLGPCSFVPMRARTVEAS